jgi:wyosine [tRNA(Phe)-imidazoG37] synthetase (radical SAM superfamily)
MSGFLFHEVVFGPVRSRRLGLSLGINLLPLHSKHCSFNCIYCECGWTPVGQKELPTLPSRELIAEALEKTLKELVADNCIPDALTYAGNGEPTIHPKFAGIVEDTIRLRDQYIPSAKVSVLSNASMVNDPKVFDALMKLDNNIQKLDAGNERMFGLINNPVGPADIEKLVEGLARFNGRVIIQSMFLRGHYRGEEIDNTKPAEVQSWIFRLKRIHPASVMIYPIARATPVHNIEKIPPDLLESIASEVRAEGIEVTVYQ